MDPCAWIYDVYNDLFGFDVENPLKRSLHPKGCSMLVDLDDDNLSYHLMCSSHLI